MVFKEIKRGDAIDLKQFQDKPLEGRYAGRKEIGSPYGKNFIHKIQKSDGKVVSFFGTKPLNEMLEQVREGILVKVTFLGKKQVTKAGGGNQDVNVFKVEVDEDVSPEVVGSNDAIEPAPEESPW